MVTMMSGLTNKFFRTSVTRLSRPDYGNGKEYTKELGRGVQLTYFDPTNDTRHFGYSQKAELVKLLEPEDFNEALEYRDWELDVFADVFLRKESPPPWEEPVILFEEHLHERRKREIYVESGIPDDTLTRNLSPDGQMMYWRTHPQGRKVSSLEDRKTRAASYYR